MKMMTEAFKQGYMSVVEKVAAWITEAGPAHLISKRRYEEMTEAFKAGFNSVIKQAAAEPWKMGLGGGLSGAAAGALLGALLSKKDDRWRNILAGALAGGAAGGIGGYSVGAERQKADVERKELEQQASDLNNRLSSVSDSLNPVVFSDLPDETQKTIMAAYPYLPWDAFDDWKATEAYLSSRANEDGISPEELDLRSKELWDYINASEGTRLGDLAGFVHEHHPVHTNR